MHSTAVPCFSHDFPQEVISTLQTPRLGSLLNQYVVFGGESHSELWSSQYYLPGLGHFPQSKCDSAGTDVVNETLFALKE